MVTEQRPLGSNAWEGDARLTPTTPARPPSAGRVGPRPSRAPLGGATPTARRQRRGDAPPTGRRGKRPLSQRPSAGRGRREEGGEEGGGGYAGCPRGHTARRKSESRAAVQQRRARNPLRTSSSKRPHPPPPPLPCGPPPRPSKLTGHKKKKKKKTGPCAWTAPLGSRIRSWQEGAWPGAGAAGAAPHTRATRGWRAVARPCCRPRSAVSRPPPPPPLTASKIATAGVGGLRQTAARTRKQTARVGGWGVRNGQGSREAGGGGAPSVALAGTQWRTGVVKGGRGPSLYSRPGKGRGWETCASRRPYWWCWQVPVGCRVCRESGVVGRAEVGGPATCAARTGGVRGVQETREEASAWPMRAAARGRRAVKSGAGGVGFRSERTSDLNQEKFSQVGSWCQDEQSSRKNGNKERAICCILRVAHHESAREESVRLGHVCAKRKRPWHSVGSRHHATGRVAVLGSAWPHKLRPCCCHQRGGSREEGAAMASG